MSCRTSSAVAPPSLTMKLPCTSDTRAEPTARFLRPSSSISLPAGIGPGFLKMQPALGAAGCEVHRLPEEAFNFSLISALEMGHAAVVNFQVVLLHLVHMAEQINAAHALHHFHRHALHRAGVHPQGPA